MRAPGQERDPERESLGDALAESGAPADESVPESGSAPAGSEVFSLGRWIHPMVRIPRAQPAPDPEPYA